MRHNFPEDYQHHIFLIAEIGLNHNGDYHTAEKMILSAASSGADAVKFQTYNPDLMYSVYTKSLMENGTEGNADRSIIDFFRTFCFSFDELQRLKKVADDANVRFFSAPFDIESVDLLERLGVSLFKVASSEVTHTRLLEKIAKCGKPVIMSTGISSEEEISSAVDFLSDVPLSLLHCVSLYPLEPSDAHLSRISALKKRFDLPVGFSDHNPGNDLALFASYAGASIIEKHFTLARDFPCPDGNVSITPEQMSFLRKSLDQALLVMGNSEISSGKSEEKVAKSARRSLFASRDISAGEIITSDDIIEKRPGVGVPASLWRSFIGKKTSCRISKDYLLRNEFFQ
ncbi:MAG TPA: N-acetylneuraminate synthase family protein [Spirochaetota bacterium]